MPPPPRIPLFVLPIVALPGELVPLHIFEERYKRMVAHCLSEGAEMGIVRTGATVGCSCEIADVLERFADGRLNIVVRGTHPFRLEAEDHEGPFPVAAVEFLADAPEPAGPEVVAEAQAAYGELVAAATDRKPETSELAQMSAYDMAATVELGPDAKQRLLELRSEPARLQLLTGLFRTAIGRLELLQGVRSRAKTNGRVQLPPEAFGR